MKIRALILLTILPLLTVPPAAGQDPPSRGGSARLTVVPARPRQGDALFIRLKESGAGSPQVSWRNRSFALHRDGDVWVGMAPVSPDTPAGGHTLRVSFTRDGRRETVSHSVPVAAVRFPVQQLRMAKRTAALYTFPGSKQEDAAVRTATHTWSAAPLWSGEWTLPTGGRMSTPFGVRRIRNGRAAGRHRGLDLASPTGTPIHAPAAGRVVLSRSFKKYGNTVVLDHGLGVTSLYLHMSALSVRKGDSVERGDLLGKVGSTGVSTGPHLHWSVYVQGDSIEPLFFCRLSKRGLPTAVSRSANDEVRMKNEGKAGAG